MKSLFALTPFRSVLLAACFFTFLGNSSGRADEPAKAAAMTPEQEAKFTGFMNNVTLKGRWYAIVDGQLGPEKQDSYNVAGVTKLEGDKWQVNAVISYGGKEMQVPVPARVMWTGDAAVLILDDVSLGGNHTYSARVMIGDKTYAGWWSGGDHGGLLNGVLAHKEK